MVVESICWWCGLYCPEPCGLSVMEVDGCEITVKIHHPLSTASLSSSLAIETDFILWRAVVQQRSKRWFRKDSQFTTLEAVAQLPLTVWYLMTLSFTKCSDSKRTGKLVVQLTSYCIHGQDILLTLDWGMNVSSGTVKVSLIIPLLTLQDWAIALVVICVRERVHVFCFFTVCSSLNTMQDILSNLNPIFFITNLPNCMWKLLSAPACFSYSGCVFPPHLFYLFPHWHGTPSSLIGTFCTLKKNHNM